MQDQMTLADMQDQRALYSRTSTKHEAEMYYAWDLLISTHLGISPRYRRKDLNRYIKAAGLV